jgi:hypothetical protein
VFLQETSCGITIFINRISNFRSFGAKGGTREIIIQESAENIKGRLGEQRPFLTGISGLENVPYLNKQLFTGSFYWCYQRNGSVLF